MKKPKYRKGILHLFGGKLYITKRLSQLILTLVDQCALMSAKSGE